MTMPEDSHPRSEHEATTDDEDSMQGGGGGMPTACYEARTENGALAVKCDEWTAFIICTTPGTSKEEVKARFAPLFKENPLKAFRTAMMFGNLRR
jgi:hypothetical protein